MDRRLAAVMEATAAEPSPLTAACRITEPMAVMEYCRPMGTPMEQSVIMHGFRGLKSSRSRRRIGNFFAMKIRQAMPETSWEITVA